MNKKHAIYKDNHIYLLDNRRSAIIPKEIKRYKSESASVTPQIKSVTDMSTFQLAEMGSAQMKSDGFRLTQLPDDSSSFDKGEEIKM